MSRVREGPWWPFCCQVNPVWMTLPRSRGDGPWCGTGRPAAASLLLTPGHCSTNAQDQTGNLLHSPKERRFRQEQCPGVWSLLPASTLPFAVENKLDKVHKQHQGSFKACTAQQGHDFVCVLTICSISSNCPHQLNVQFEHLFSEASFLLSSCKKLYLVMIL